MTTHAMTAAEAKELHANGAKIQIRDASDKFWITIPKEGCMWLESSVYRRKDTIRIPKHMRSFYQ